MRYFIKRTLVFVLHPIYAVNTLVSQVRRVGARRCIECCDLMRLQSLAGNSNYSLNVWSQVIRDSDGDGERRCGLDSHFSRCNPACKAYRVLCTTNLAKLCSLQCLLLDKACVGSIGVGPDLTAYRHILVVQETGAEVQCRTHQHRSKSPLNLLHDAARDAPENRSDRKPDHSSDRAK